MLAERLRQALARLNHDLLAEVTEDAFRKVMRPQGATFEARNRALHRLLVDGITVEYQFAALRDTLLPKLLSDEVPMA